MRGCARVHAREHACRVCAKPAGLTAARTCATCLISTRCARPPTRPQRQKLNISKDEKKAKRGIMSSGAAGNSGGPEIDIKAWKAAQKAAATGDTADAPAKGGDKGGGKGGGKVTGGEAADACAAAAKQALKAVDGHGGKKENVVKGFVSTLTKGGSGAGAAGAGGAAPGDWYCPNCKIVCFATKTQCFVCRTPKTDFSAAQLNAAAAAATAAAAGAGGKDKKAVKEEPQLVAAVEKTRSTVKNPRTLLTEYCQKNKLPKVGITVREEKPKVASEAAAKAPAPPADAPWWEQQQDEWAQEGGEGSGFRGKVIQHAADKDGKATVRFTKGLYSTAEEAQQAAAVLGLFLVAGDRRMDRVLAAEYVSLWKEAEDDERQRKEKEAEREKWRKEQEARDEKARKRQEAMTQLYLSDSLFSLLGTNS